MPFSRCFGSLCVGSPQFPAHLEQLYAAHKTDGIRGRCLLHASSYTLVLALLGLSFFNLAGDKYTLFSVTYRVQVAAVGIAALLYATMFVAHKRGGAVSRKLRTFNNAAQTGAAVYICMVAPVVEPYRLMKLLGSTYAIEMERLFADRGPEEALGLKEICGGWVQDAGPNVVCSFVSYEAMVMAIIIHVMASAAIFGRTSPRWIFFAWHWNFAWYVFVRAVLGDVNSHTHIFRQDACILYITLGTLYLSGRRVDQLLRAEFLHTHEVEHRANAISRARTYASETAGDEQGVQQPTRSRRSLSWPGKSTSSFSSKPHQPVVVKAPVEGATPIASRAPLLSTPGRDHAGIDVGFSPLDPVAIAKKGRLLPGGLRASVTFTPIGIRSSSAPSVASDTMTQSSVGSLPFAWPKARPVEEGNANRPACYPVAEAGGRASISMRKLARQTVSSCSRQAKGSRRQDRGHARANTTANALPDHMISEV